MPLIKLEAYLSGLTNICREGACSLKTPANAVDRQPREAGKGLLLKLELFLLARHIPTLR